MSWKDVADKKKEILLNYFFNWIGLIYKGDEKLYYTCNRDN